MFGLLKRDNPGLGFAFFPGSAPPPAEAFGFLRDHGIELEHRRPAGDPQPLWAMRARHPQLGEAELACFREPPPIEGFVKFAHNLTESERTAALGAAAAVAVRLPATKANVLRDRKLLLRFGERVLGADGVVFVDLASRLPWSRAALADELAHDADLDVEALYSIDAVYDATPEDPRWLHTHGLGELGAFDFDFVGVHPAFAAQCSDPVRAIASMALDEAIARDTSEFVFGYPGGEARMLPANEFMSKAAQEFASARDADGHDEDRSVVCEPVRRRLFGLGGGGGRPEPLRFARRPPPDQFVNFFSKASTDLSAERARATLAVLRSGLQEFAEFQVVGLAKLGFDQTSQDGREHLWFQVHSIGAETIDATCTNTPFDVDSLQEGLRGEWELSRLSDWILMTPAGTITPRSQQPARLLREDPETYREIIRNAG
jgi:hypothetical protein